jgi:hypothetical protein
MLKGEIVLECHFSVFMLLFLGSLELTFEH